MLVISTWPILYHRGKSGALYIWEVWTKDDQIHTKYGMIDGQQQESCKTADPKNVGRSNSTTGEQQAKIEAEAMWQFRVTRKYSQTQAEAQESCELPMLAQTLSKHLKKVYWPLDGQFKLDGVRALARWRGKRVVLTSRQGRDWETCKHITEELEKYLPKDDVLDGEIYIHGMRFQEITSLVKRLQAGTLKLKFHSYDMPEHGGDESMYWSERRLSHKMFFQKYGEALKNTLYVPYKELDDMDELEAFHIQAIEAGYEGSMYRLHNGLYEYDYRSYDLLKKKDFEDDEFVVVGHETGDGKYADCVKWICEAPNGLTFTTTQNAPLDELREMLPNAHSYYGRKLTVRYFGWTDKGLPRHVKGVGFPEDK